MTAQSAHWPDLPPLASLDVGSDGVRVVFQHATEVAWTVVSGRIAEDGKPHVLHYVGQSARSGNPVHLDESASPNLKHLAAIWARALNLGASDEGEPFDLFSLVMPKPAMRKTLGQKPDKRRARRDPDGYADAMRDWTAPIADLIRTATAQARPVQAAVREAFSASPETPFTNTYAERLIAWAHEYHDLPRRGGGKPSLPHTNHKPKAPATKRKNPTRPGRADK